MPPASEVMLPPDLLAEPVVPATESHEPVHAEANTAFDDQIDLVRAAAPGNDEEETATELLARAGQRSATVFHAAGVAGREFWGTFRGWGDAFQTHARGWMERGREQVNLRREEIKMQRAQKAQEDERRRALEQERAAELEAAREAAAVRLQELLRERGGLTEAQPAPPQKSARPMPSPAAPAAVNPIPGLFTGRIKIPFSCTYRPQLEAVLMGVGACGMLLLCAGTGGGIVPCASGDLKHHSTAKPATAGISRRDCPGRRSYGTGRCCRGFAAEGEHGSKAKPCGPCAVRGEAFCNSRK